MSKRRLGLSCGLLLGLAAVGLVVILRAGNNKPSTETPTWHGIVPGETTQWDVIAIMGTPYEVNKCHIDGEGDMEGVPRFPENILPCFSPILTYKYKEVRIVGKPPAENEIRFKFATVWAVVEDPWLSPEESSPVLLKRLIQEYGPPEKVTWAKKYSGRRAYLYCQHGVFVLTSHLHAHQIYYFVPMPLDLCLKEFADEVTTTDPYSNSPFPRIENPWPELIDAQ